MKTGGRGKAGGVKVAKSPEEAEQKASEILGMDIKGHTVHQVMIAQGAQIAEEYPEIVSDKAGKKGWKDLRCEQGTPDPDQEGKIRCANEELGVSVVKYADEFDRDDAVPDPREAVVLGSGECTVNSYELPDANPPAYVMTPQDKPEYLMIINGLNSEEQRLDLPLCQ